MSSESLYYNYVTKGLCDIAGDGIVFDPRNDDRGEIFKKAAESNQPVIIKTAHIKHFWDFFKRNEDKQILVLYGGSGGGKSYSVIQYLIHKLFTIKDIKVAMYRKSGSSLRASIIDTVLSILSEEGYLKEIDYTYNITNKTITIHSTGSTLEFKSLDDPAKIKSTAYNFANMEELTEFTIQDLMMVRNTLRRNTEGVRNQLFVTFNPVDINHWVWSQWLCGIVANDPIELAKVGVNHSTFINNPYLPQVYVDTLLNSIKIDKNWYNVYALGLPGTLENVIFTNWAKFNSTDFPNYGDGDFYYGVDFGYNNPTAIVEICKGPDNIVYAREILYQTQLTTADLIDYLNNNHPIIKQAQYPLYCDSAEPDRIHQLQDAGYNAIPASKDVKAGIDRMKRYKIMIPSNCENLIREISNYKWAEDRNGNILEYPVKISDHLMDAMRYCIMVIDETNEDSSYLKVDDVYYLDNNTFYF